MENPRLSPRGRSQRPGMGWEMRVGSRAGRPSRLTCSLAPAHLKTAVPAYWRADGIAGRMRGSGRWEMARGAARMIHSNTEGHSGSSKGKGREKGNKKPNSLLFLRNLFQKAIIQKCCMKQCCGVHGTVPRSPGCRGTGQPPVPVGERLMVTAGQDTGRLR